MTKLELALLGKAMIDPENQPPQFTVDEALQIFNSEIRLLQELARKNGFVRRSNDD